MTRIIGAICKNTGEFTRPNLAIKGKEYECIDCKCPLFFKKGRLNIPHFAHCCFSNSCKTCEITEHKIAKNMLKNLLEMNRINITKMCHECGQEYNENVNIFDLKIIIRNDEYNDVICSSNGEIIYKFFIYHEQMQSQISTQNDYIAEFDANDLINNYNTYIKNCAYNEKINLKCIKKYILKCNNKNICDNCSNPRGKIYFNQRGAGCGKTYESIQLLTQKSFIFRNKNIFIYLTKVHSAKDVIYGELLEQQNRGALSNLVVIDEDDSSGKQYKMTYLNIETNKEILVIIGTIDSFNYAIANRNNVPMTNDYFTAIVGIIKSGNMTISSKNKNLNYAKKNPMLNENCLIIVDESQDLIEDQIRAFDVIVNMTNIDVYVIGDKLQSIWREDNVYTCIDNAILDTPIIKNVGINKCLRFHNNQFIHFVNSLIPFKQYNLSPITEICDGNCRYIHENDIKPYTVFETPKMKTHESSATEVDYAKMTSIVKYIMEQMDNEIKKYNYLPNNFMFIFPILSKNVFAQMIEIEIQKYWKNKFNDVQYRQNVLMNDDYWKNIILDENNDENIKDQEEDEDNGPKYIFLHKSEEGRSINLNESENASRIVSIHTSKGTGREVVFVLCMSELTIKIFSKHSPLVYESLLHVALTRQKKSIYVGIENNNDDICRRFKKFYRKIIVNNISDDNE